MKIIDKLREKRASVLPLAIALILSFFIIFASVSEYLRLKLIVSGVKEAIQSSVISVSIENYSNVYGSSREGYSGGYEYIDNEEDWEETIETRDVYEKLNVLLDLENKKQYILSDLNVKIINTPFAPNSNEDVFEADTYASLEVPLSFGWEHLPSLKIKLKVKSEYMAKF
ncbi:MAG: hypothetical protein RBQ97_07035 [Acholeplasma sp.]|nr:hypothetical protein [Acholeplasma sp.]